MERYQNISTVTTNVMKRTAQGEFKSNTLKPGQVIHLTDDDIEYTRDSFNPRENNPFDLGWVAAIPKGQSAHPDVPKLPKNPNQKKVAEIFTKGRKETEKMIENIYDQRGLVIVLRTLEAERQSLGQIASKEIEEMVDRRQGQIERIQRERASKFALNN